MVMLSVYFDESYNHPTDSNPNPPLVYTIAGYISTDKRWRKFQREWREVLKEAGVAFFHMSKYEARKGEYENWPQEKRVRILKKLHSIILKYYIQSVATTVILSDYNELTEREKLAFGHPHVMAVIACMKDISIWGDYFGYREPMAYIFEAGSDHEGEMNRMFRSRAGDEEFKRHYRFGSWAFVDKRDMPPLQAADILAYEITKETSRQRDAGNTRPLRLSMINLSQTNRDIWRYYSREEFAEVLRHMRPLMPNEDES